MSTVSEIQPTKNRSNVVTGILARFGQVAILLLVQAAILFLAAGRPNWIWAWVFLGIYLVSVAINSVFLMRVSPETIAERGQAKESKDWDKLVSGLWSLAQFLILPLVAGLDMRFGWSQNYSTLWHVAGAMVFAVGLGIFG